LQGQRIETHYLAGDATFNVAGVVIARILVNAGSSTDQSTCVTPWPAPFIVTAVPKIQQISKFVTHCRHSLIYENCRRGIR
jgi:hypothetical protein